MSTDGYSVSYEQVVKWYFEVKNSKEYMSSVKSNMSLKILKDRYYDRVTKEYPEELL